MRRARSDDIERENGSARADRKGANKMTTWTDFGGGECAAKCAYEYGVYVCRLPLWAGQGYWERLVVDAQTREEVGRGPPPCALGHWAPEHATI